MNSMVGRYGAQIVSEEDIRAVVEVLRSDWLTQGPLVARFEAAVAEYCGARYAVAVSSATAGLHLSTLAAGFGEGDEVITSPISLLRRQTVRPMSVQSLYSLTSAPIRAALILPRSEAVLALVLLPLCQSILLDIPATWQRSESSPKCGDLW